MVLPSTTGSASMEMSTDCIDLEPSEAASVRHTPMVAWDTRSPTHIDVSDSIQWAPCGGSESLRIRGNFTVVLWDWDFEITNATGMHRFETGRTQPSTMGGLPDTTAVVSRDQEAWIHVQDGLLDLPLAPATYAIYADGTEMSTATGFSFRDPSGRLLLHDEPIEGSRLDLQGDLLLDATSSPNGLSSSVSGSLRGAIVDGQPLAIQIQEGRGVPLPWWALLAALPVAYVAQRRLRARRHLGKARKAPHRSPLVALHTTRAIRLNRRLGEAYLLRAFARTTGGDLEGAMQDHEAADKLLRGSARAKNALEAALSAELLGQRDQRWNASASRWRQLREGLSNA